MTHQGEGHEGDRHHRGGGGNECLVYGTIKARAMSVYDIMRGSVMMLYGTMRERAMRLYGIMMGSP